MGNYTYFMNNTKKKPCFVRLWTTWCPHCKGFETTWNELIKLPQYQDNLFFLSVECDTYRELCKKFEGENYPRLYWWDTEQQKAYKYMGERSTSHIDEFLKKQFNPSLIEIRKNQSELDVYINNSNSIPAFVLYLQTTESSENLNSYMAQFTNLSYLFRRTELPFIIAYDISENEKSHFGVFTSSDYFLPFNGNFFNIDHLTDFVVRYTYPFYMEMNGYNIRQMDLFDFRYFMSIQRQNPESNLTLLRDVHQIMPVTKLNCSTKNSWFCKYFGVNDGPTAEILGILDWKNRLFWIYDGNTTENIKQWINDVNQGKIKGSGPGKGIFSSWKNAYYEYRAESGSAISIIVYLPLLIAFLLIMAILACSDSGEEEKMRKLMMQKHKLLLEQEKLLKKQEKLINEGKIE